MKILTISIAAFNAESFIQEAIDSILKSKFIESIQVIVVNDGSTDKTSEIASEYSKKHPDSIILINKENGGYGSTINSSLKVATGKYFKLLDADDWFNTDELDKLTKYLSKASADIVISDYFKFYEESSQYNRIKAINIEPDTVYNIENLTVYNLNPAMTIKTEILKDPSFIITENCFYTDLEFCVRAVLLSSSYVYYPVSVYCYRIGRLGQSISLEGRIKHIENHNYIVRLVAKMILNNPKFTSLYENTYKMLIGHIKNYRFYVKPTLSNLRKFKEYCEFINTYAQDARQYFDIEVSKAFSKPNRYYLLICARNRFVYMLKKCKKRLFKREKK